ncbi:GntR family transcriptional regulator [Listeria aquatica]|uniref:GntR family transcriptional regulator n=1 Tax=Listeria aquatica TaxID=1494960 RepID=UPI003EF77458
MKRNVVLYQEIATKIKKKILDGSYPLGENIPSEPELEKLFGVSKMTIRQAVALLAAEGYVDKQRGKGTQVISNQLFNKLSKAKSFSKIIEESGFSIKKEILSIETIKPESHPVLATYFDEPITHIKRLYYLDNKPYIYYQHYIQEVTQIHEANLNLDHISLYQLLKENGYTVASFEDTFETATFSTYEKKQLQTEQENGLKRMRKSSDNSGHLIELSIGLYNTQIFPYKIEYEV